MRLRSALCPLAPLLGALLLGGCSDEPAEGASATPPPPADPPYVPPPESCDAPSLGALREFPACNTGSGIFGTWVVDELGLPAYEYGLDQNADARASFFNTEGLDRREHWAAFGNARVDAMAYNDGYVEVTVQDRGETYLNKFDETQRNVAGGFGYLDDGAAVWATAYKWRPAGAKTSRRFGMGYAEATMEHRGVRVVRRTYSPAGDAAVVIDDVTLENLSSGPKSLAHYEVWDVGRRPIEIAWIASGKPLGGVPADLRQQRDARNDAFVEEVSWAPDEKVLGLRRAHAPGTDPPDPVTPDPIDHYPGDPFVAALAGEVSDVFTEQDAFLGEGGLAAPDAVARRLPGHGLAEGAVGEARSGLGQPRMLTLRSDVELAPGETKRLRFAFGQARWGEAWPIEEAWRDVDRDLWAEQADALREHLAYFAADRDPFLHREMAWHAYQLEASVAVRDYWGVHVVPQGSTYLYLHGADGAARDLSLFAVPLVYTHPELAREELALNMMVTHAEGRRISYAFQGHGMLDDALGLHGKPSDLTIFLLWALSEYVGATGDVAFLDAPMPYYPVEAVAGATVWDHLTDAVRHLFDTVGTGEHGLVRVQTGDWSDGIVMNAPDRDVAIEKGESVPNTQMAAAVLPRVADLVEPRDPALAQEIRDRVVAYREAVAGAWTGSYFGRAYFGDGALFHADTIDLEAQVWSLVGDVFASPADRDELMAAVFDELDEPSPAGATLVPGGQVWPAISALLTWGYAKSDPERAWAHLARNTLAGHALAFPEVWYGIWSGPDGLEGPGGELAGQSWYSPVTPMVDFPTMNNNQHAMPLLAMLRVAGVDATATGLRIAPAVPGRRFAMQTALLDLSQEGATIAGAYRPRGGVLRTVEVVAPAGEAIAAASVDGTAVAVTAGAPSIVLEVPVVAPGEAVAFEVTTSP